MAKQHEEMKAKLASLGLGFEKIHVFGAIRCNVHVQCISRDTASKWASVLGKVFAGAKVVVAPTVWDAVTNKGTCLRPTQRHGFLVAVAACP